MSVGKDIVNSIIGNTETAVLKVYDYRSAASKSDPLRGMAQMHNILTTGLPLGMETGNAEEKLFTVQFNPSQLSLSANTGNARIQNVEQKPGESPKIVEVSVEEPEVELSVELLFDQVINQDSFLSDRLIPAAGAVAGNIGTAVKSLNGKGYTVQPQVEGLIAALHNRFTRLVCFQWGDFSFSGALKDIQASYTMFSLSGRPVRAKVNLRILRAAALDMGSWKKDYEKAFENGADFTSLSQQAGSVLNLPF